MLPETLADIRPVDPEVLLAARRRQALLTKPPGSLGRLETLAERVCAIQGTLAPSVLRAAVVVFAADHGIAAEGVSAYPQEVTRQMVANFASGGAAVCALARSAGAKLVVVDVGVATPCDQVVSRRVRAGTASFVDAPAMTRSEAIRAIEVGIATASELDVDLLALGEMGIANSTTAAALTAVLCDAPPSRVTGRGTGVSDDQHAHKIAVIERALAHHRPSPADPIELLAAIGGLELAAIAGACLGAARARRVILLDGFICTAGAAIAAALAPAAVDFMVAAHRSPEPGHALLLELLQLDPILDLGLRLGEASGAALAIPVVRAAVATFREMATFADAGVSEAS